MTTIEWLALVSAIAQIESHGDPLAVGKDGDLGLLQVTPVMVRNVNRLTGERWQHDRMTDETYCINFFRRFIEAHRLAGAGPERIARRWHMTSNWRGARASRYWKKVKPVYEQKKKSFQLTAAARRGTVRA